MPEETLLDAGTLPCVVGEPRRRKRDAFKCLNVCGFVSRICKRDPNFESLKSVNSSNESFLQRGAEIQHSVNRLVILSAPNRFADLFEIGDIIGEGGFGTVYRAKPTEVGLGTFPWMGEACAVKKIRNAFKRGQPLEDINLSALTVSSERSGEFFQKLTSDVAWHNNIVMIHGQVIEPRMNRWRSSGVNALIMEVLEGADLFGWMYERHGTMSKQHPTEDEVACLSLQILTAIHYLHRVAGCLHRDIKLDNFGFTRPVQSSGALPTLKMFDFGTCWILAAPVTEETASDVLSLNASGTWRFMAPEVLKDQCGSMSDVWSAGLIIHHLLFGKLPLGLGDCIDERSVRKAHKSNSLSFDPAKFGNTSQLALDFISSMLHKDGKARATTSAALDDSWLKATSYPSPVSPKAGTPQSPFPTTSHSNYSDRNDRGWSF